MVRGLNRNSSPLYFLETINQAEREDSRRARRRTTIFDFLPPSILPLLQRGHAFSLLVFARSWPSKAICGQTVFSMAKSLSLSLSSPFEDRSLGGLSLSSPNEGTKVFPPPSFFVELSPVLSRLTANESLCHYYFHHILLSSLCLRAAFLHSRLGLW